MRHSRETCVVMLLWLIFGCVGHLAADELPAPAPDERPNILWLSAEDIGPQLACYGDKTAKTPNIARLAKRGMVYDLAWSNYPVCAPARTTIITGRYAAANGAGNMRCSVPLGSELRMFPALLRESGYGCFNNRKEDYNHPKTEKVWDQSSGKAHYENRKSGQPFFAVFNNTQTHESKIRKRPHQAIIRPDAVSLLPYWPDTQEVRTDWAQYYDNLMTLDQWVGRKLNELEKNGLSEDTIVVFFGDHGSGMPRHKRYAGDSGMRVPLIVYVPEKWRKLAPEEYTAGGRSNRPVGFVDFAPTMLSLAGVQPPPSMQGRAFMGPHQRPPKELLFGLRDRMDERIDMSRSMRDQRFLYIRNFMPHLPHGQKLGYQMMTPTTRTWKKKFDAGELNEVQSKFWSPRAAEELYDLESDPHETKNLSADPAFADEVKRFRAALRDKMIEVRDTGFLPESQMLSLGNANIVGYCASDENYPVAQLYDLACLASSGGNLETVIAAAESKNPAIRYWASLALTTHGQAIFGQQRELVKKLSADPAEAVSIAACEAMARFGDGPERERALKTLLKLSDYRNGNYYAAMHALNAIDRLGQIAEPIHAALQKQPSRDPAIKRGEDYVKRLQKHIAE